MNNGLKYSVFKEHITLTQHFIIKNVIFTEINYTEGNGGAIFLNNTEAICEITYCYFYYNAVSGNSRQAGSIYIANCNRAIYNCSYTYSNTGYYAASTWMSCRSKYFILLIDNIAIANSYQSSDYTHLEVFGGDPLHISNYNVSNCDCPSYGVTIDYLKGEEHNVLSFIALIDNIVGDGYFMHDKYIDSSSNFPKTYYLDKSVFIDNTIDKFFSDRTIDDITPIFYNCDFIFNKKVPIFKYEITFNNCYFEPQITNKGSGNFITTLTSKNNILNDIEELECVKSQNIIIYEDNNEQYRNALIFTSLFLLQSKST